MSVESKTTADVPGAAPAAPGAPPAAPPAAPKAPAPNAAPPAPPAPPQAPPPAAAPAKGDPVAIAKADEALKDAQDQLSEMDKWLEGAKVERAARLAKVETAQVKLDSLQTVQTNNDAIQAYLAQQRAILSARGEKQAAIVASAKEAGLTVAQYLSNFHVKRAPIDAAMARKTARGTQRPGVK